MKKTKFFKSVLALFLAVSLAVPNMTSAFAATRLFVKELKIVYASSPAEARKKLGSEYTLVQRSEKDKQGKLKKYDCSLTEGSYDSDPNNGNNGTQNVYLAYSTTTNQEEALTDISAMFMNGNFDTTSYDSILENFKISVAEEAQLLNTLITEYRNNYNEEEKEQNTTGKAHAAYTYLSMFYDEDYLYEDYKDMDEEELAEIEEPVKYMSLADEFLDENICTIEHLTDMYVQGNTNVLLSVEQAISVAQGGEKTWLERLSETSYDKLVEKVRKMSAKYNSKDAAEKHIQQMYANSLDSLCESWYDIDQNFKVIEELEKPIEEMTEEELNEKFPDIEEQGNALKYNAAIKKLKETPYKNSNVYDVLFKNSAEDIQKDPREYYALLSILTQGEMVTVKNTSMLILITNIIPEDNDYSEAIEEAEEFYYDSDAEYTSQMIATQKADGTYNLKTFEQITVDGVEDYEVELEKGEKIISEAEENYEIEPLSVYSGIDREFFKSGVALTKESFNKIVVDGENPLEDDEEAKKVSGICFGILFVSSVGAFIVSSSTFVHSLKIYFKAKPVVDLYNINNNVPIKKMVKGVETVTGYGYKLEKVTARASSIDDAFSKLNNNITDLNGLTGTSPVDDFFAGHAAKNLESFENEKIITKMNTLETNPNMAKLKFSIGMGVLTCVFAALMTLSCIKLYKAEKETEERIEQRESAKYEYPIDIPERMCWAKDTIETLDGEKTDTAIEGKTVTVTDFFFYNAVKNTDGICADIFAKTQKQWVTLYTTNDWGCGYPILADSLTIKTGSALQSDSYEKAVHIFGQKSSYAQNLHDSSDLKLTEANDTEGFYIFYNCYKPIWADWKGDSSFADILPVIIYVFCACGITAAGVVVIIKKKKKNANAQ